MMQISQVKADELGILIAGLRAVWFSTDKEQKTQQRLLQQLEGELSRRFGLVLKEPA